MEGIYTPLVDYIVISGVNDKKFRKGVVMKKRIVVIIILTAILLASAATAYARRGVSSPDELEFSSALTVSMIEILDIAQSCDVTSSGSVVRSQDGLADIHSEIEALELPRDNQPYWDVMRYSLLRSIESASDALTDMDSEKLNRATGYLDIMMFLIDGYSALSS